MFLPSNITLKFGDTGDFVAELQRRLANVHCFSAEAVNGFYDGMTVNAVMQFQGSHGLHADGVAGPETLRRLNGVIAGDTSNDAPTDNTQQEEAAQRLSAYQSAQMDLAQQAALPPEATYYPPAEPVAEPAYQTHAAAYVPEPPPPIEPAPPQPAPLPFTPPQEMPPESQGYAAPSAGDSLAAMLGVGQAPAAQPYMPEPQPFQRHPLDAAMPPAAAPAPHAFAVPNPAPMPVMPAETVAPSPAAMQPAVMAEPAPAAQPTGGLIHRAVRFTNSMMQKLADYFEAKLPPSVLREVQQIGMTMAQQGMKETPVPTGPELPGREQIPARGPEQPQVQRG